MHTVIPAPLANPGIYPVSWRNLAIIIVIYCNFGNLPLNDWLNHPALQSGAAPFAVALITAKLLNGTRLAGLAAITGFCATVYLAADFNFEQLTAVRKIILCGLVAAVIAPLLDLAPRNWHCARYLIAAVCGAAALWVFWSILRQKELTEAVVYGAGIAANVMWLVTFMDRLSGIPIRAGAAGMSLGVGVGASALLAASALLGQLGLSIGAACGAYLLVHMINGKPLSCGRTFTLPASLLCGLIALAATLLARLPWYCLPLFAVIPMAAHVPLPRNWPPRRKIMVLSLLTLAIAAAALFLAACRT